jgi:hypothetical protein
MFRLRNRTQMEERSHVSLITYLCLSLLSAVHSNIATRVTKFVKYARQTYHAAYILYTEVSKPPFSVCYVAWQINAHTLVRSSVTELQQMAVLSG